ncbi:hypothetical protein G9P44_000374 [Scheffersomyces stipitis]|nr:hypothetical protein G9P44_000374 [Scheffersomyces stipitis]
MVRLFVPKFRSIHHLLLLLVLGWIVTFLVHERLVPYLTIGRCKWPQVSPSHLPNKDVVQDDELDGQLLHSDQDQDSRSSDDVTNVLLIADPQLIDNHTYPGRNEWLLKLSQHTVDVYLKRNYKNMIRQLKPDYVFFLGDYLDNARDSRKKYYLNELKRFNSIFYDKTTTSANYKKDTNWFVNVPGNHDIGFSDLVNLKARKRFIKNFGNPNSITTINNVDFISLDSLSLSSSESQINAPAKEFVNSNYGSNIVKTNPRVLLTHVPLYRDPSLSCGSLRESTVFDVEGKGYQYKSTIDKSISEDLLEKIEPDIIFTGDDHDYCDIVHPETKSREITVKSISMAMGIRYPAVQMLSFTNSEKEDHDGTDFKYNTNICYAQTPYVNVAHYVTFAVISGLLILWWNIKQRSARLRYSSILPINADTVSIELTTNSSKIQNFLREQDEEDLNTPPASAHSEGSHSLPTVKPLNIPLYTFTGTQSGFFDSSRIGQFVAAPFRRMAAFSRNWNLVPFFKHSLFMALVVISIYYVGFCMTL